MKERILAFFSNRAVIWTVYAIAAIAVSWQKIALGFDEKGYSRYENYRIFKYSWPYFISGQNPYAGHPETWDLFKYSPAFSVCMAPFYALPDWVGLPLWNLLNAWPLLFVLLAIPHLSQAQRTGIAWLVLPELVLSMQNAQSNGLMAALFVATYNDFQRDRPFRAASWVMAGTFLKIFGIFAALLVLFHRKQWGRFGAGMVFWSLFLAIFPIFFVEKAQLLQVYQWWWWLLQEDHSASVGLSVMGWLQTWFGLFPDKTGLTLVGLVLLVGSTIYQAYRGISSLWCLSSLLLWVVVFNHKAESPTFVIAMTGAAIWHLSLAQKQKWAQILFWVAWFMASFSPSDLFPKSWYHDWVQPYCGKAVPFILIWGILVLQSIRQEIVRSKT